MLDAKKAIGTERTPTLDGERLARYVHKVLRVAREPVYVDMREVAPEDMVSSFVNAFLHTLSEAGWSEAQLRRINWLAKYSSEAARLSELCDLYFSADPSKGSGRAKRSTSSLGR